eukprot:COSAG02_NODE_93_length_37477_cov_78.101129_25_plen_145_part_00
MSSHNSVSLHRCRLPYPAPPPSPILQPHQPTTMPGGVPPEDEGGPHTLDVIHPVLFDGNTVLMSFAFALSLSLSLSLSLPPSLSLTPRSCEPVCGRAVCICVWPARVGAELGVDSEATSINLCGLHACPPSAGGLLRLCRLGVA